MSATQTIGFWASAVIWFVLQVKGTDARSLGNACAVVGSKGVERNVHLLVIVPMLVSLKSKATNVSVLGISERKMVRRKWNGGSASGLGIRLWNGFLQVIIHATACTGRTLGFLSRMRASVSRMGIESTMACSRMVTQANPEWVSSHFWLASGLFMRWVRVLRCSPRSWRVRVVPTRC